jgi:mannose-6-phosphate isomerase-like protein (cupin superfamily)
MNTINIAEKFSQFEDLWSPKILGEVNDSYVKAVKLRGEFVWHRHDHEDEMFLVVKGELRMKFNDREEVIRPGEFIIVPRGIEHLPIADEETHILLFEPKSTLNTGNVINERTVAQLEKL